MTNHRDRGRILVVDDEPGIRDTLVDVLQDEGYTAVGVANGKEALDYLRTCDELPDLILLDLLMPVMDGVEFRQAQLADPGLRDIVTVVVSANAQIEERVAGLKLAGILRKPLDLMDLLNAVEHHLQAAPAT